MINKQCPGCGVVLQATDPDQPGFYIQPENAEVVFCQRCFRLRHYGQLKQRADDRAAIERNSNGAQKSDFILLVADVLTRRARYPWPGPAVHLAGADCGQQGGPLPARHRGPR